MEEKLLNEKRRLWKYIIFGVLTLGIYDLIFMWNMVKDLNKACGYVENGDEDRSPNFLIMIIFNILTLGIYNYVWYYKQGNRIKRAGKLYGLEIDEKGSTYVLWSLFGILLFGIGPLVTMYLFFSNLNKICRLYNYQIQNGEAGGFVENPSKIDTPERGYTPQNLSYGNGSKATGDLINQGSSGPNSPYNWIPDDIPTQGKRATGLVRCIRGAYTGAEMELKSEEPLVIGRSSTYSQLIISDPDISRKHCTVKYSANDGYYYVVDHSTFGVLLNESQKLEKEVMTKCPVGTTLTLGNGNNVFILQ